MKPNKPKTKRLVVMVAPSFHQKVSIWAQRADVSYGEFVRRALTKAMDEGSDKEASTNGNTKKKL